MGIPAVTEGQVIVLRSTLGKSSPFPTFLELFTVVLEEASINAGLFAATLLVALFTVLI